MNFLHKILALATLVVALIMAMLVVANLDSIRVLGWNLGNHISLFVERLLQLTLYCVGGAGVLGALGGITWIGVAIARRRNENLRQRDGSYPLQRVRIGQATVIIDPNKTVAPALVVSPQGIVEIFTAAPQLHLSHAIERARVAQMQALAPGDAAIASRYGSQFRPAGRALSPRMLGEGRQTEHLPLATAATPDAPDDSPTPAPAQRLYLSQVLERATPTQLIAGQDDATGDLAIFDPTQAIHAGIVGATGTGKTTSAGYTLVAQALRTGYHVVIIDPKGGADWSAWRNHAEWHASDAEVFPAQLDMLWNEHSRRVAQGGQHQPVLVLIEEYGDLIAQLRRLDRQRAAAADAMLDRLMRLSRASRIHLLLIDQYPEHWSQQVIANTKWLAAFRLGPNQGAKIGQYRADRLPDRGRFLVRGREYDAWFAAAHLDKLLERTPASAAPRVIEGEFTVRSQAPEGGATSGEQATNAPTNASMNASMNAVPATAAEWYDWVIGSYLPSHPELLQVDAEGRGVGVSSLARAMAQLARGDASQYAAFKGIASEVAKRLRAELRLPTGDRIGTDISRTEAAQL